MSHSRRPFDFQDERSSGVYLRADKVEAPPTAESIADDVRALVGEGEDGQVLVLVAARAGCPPRACARPVVRQDEAGYPLALRLVSWVGALDHVAIATVPRFIEPWMPKRTALVVPMRSPAWLAGAIVVGRAALAHLDALQSLAAELAVRLEGVDRRASFAALRAC